MGGHGGGASDDVHSGRQRGFTSDGGVLEDEAGLWVRMKASGDL